MISGTDHFNTDFVPCALTTKVNQSMVIRGTHVQKATVKIKAAHASVVASEIQVYSSPTGTYY